MIGLYNINCGKNNTAAIIVGKFSFCVTIFLVFYLQAKLETKALKAKRPGFTDERYNETSYYVENGKLNVNFIVGK